MVSKSDSEFPVDLFKYMALFRSVSSLIPSFTVACGNASTPCCPALQLETLFVVSVFVVVIVAVGGGGGGARSGNRLAEPCAADLLTELGNLRDGGHPHDGLGLLGLCSALGGYVDPKPFEGASTQGDSERIRFLGCVGMS